MNIHRYPLARLVVLILTVSLWLAGCSSPAPAAAPAPKTPLAATSGDRTGVTDTEVVIGTWGPQSGPAATYGIVDRAMDCTFKYVNDKEGGVNGRKIRFIYEDDAYSAARTPAVVKKLVEQDKVFALVGGLGTANNLAVMDYLVQNGVPHISPATGSSLMANPPRRTVFALQTNYVTEANILTGYAVDSLKANSVVVFYQNDAFGKEGRDTVAAVLEKRGKKLAGDVPYEASETDFSSHVLKARSLNPDTVILWSLPSPTAKFANEAEKLGWRPRFLMSAVNNDPVMFQLAPTALNGIIMASWLPDVFGDHPRAKFYRDEIHARCLANEPVSGFGLAGQAHAELLVEGLRRAGRDLTREGLVAALEGMKDWNGGTAYKVSYGPNQRQGQNAAYIYQADAAAKRFKTLGDVIEYK